MKVFQILDGFCHWDATLAHGTAEEARKLFAPDIIFEDAPDYVFEGWGYDDSKEGDERFLKPIPPEGWLYDETNGTFYDPNWVPPETTDQKVDRLEKENALLQAQIRAATDRNDFLEDCIAELAIEVYS